MAAPPCPLEFITFAEQLADRARLSVLEHFREDLAVDEKSDLTPVTAADRETESALRGLIQDTYPEHGILGEEYPALNPDAELLWVLDPIDGTKSFITGSPMFGTLIALAQGGRPLLGIIDMPVLDERWVGARGFPTRFHERRGTRSVATRPCADLSDAYLRTMTPDAFDGEARHAGFQNLLRGTRMTLYGGDCYSFGQVASGGIDIVVENGLATYDFAALVPVVEGAGGLMVDCDGREITLDSAGDVLALGDRQLLDPALRLLNN